MPAVRRFQFSSTKALFCFGQGLVLAPLYGVVLAQVRPAQAGAGAGVLTTVQQIGNGVGAGEAVPGDWWY